MLEMLPLTFNYVLLNVASVGVMFLLLSEIFPRRWSIVWCVYFLAKAIIDAYLWYPGALEAAPAWVTPLATLWTASSSIISFIVICLSFRGDYILVSTCAVLCDPLVSGMTTAGLLVSDYVFGRGVYEGYFVPFVPHTIVALTTLVTLYLLIRVHIVRLMKLVCRSVLRHRLVWGSCAVAIAFMFAMSTHKTSNFSSLSTNLFDAVLALVIFLTVVAIVVLRQSWQLRLRRRTLQDCLALSERYDRAVREQLAQLEQDRTALEGHEIVLERLRTQENRPAAERIEQLEQAYQQMSTGSYCEQPALDAVLLAAQQRLGEAGVDATITVAGIPSSVSVPVMEVLAVANLACEAARRAFDRGDNHVNLRIRGIGNQVLVHLDVPAAWGALWVRRYLPMLDSHDTGLIRERKESDRRVVTVMCEGVSA